MNEPELVYTKENHFIDSPSVFWDLDSFVYIFVLALIIFGIVRLVQKKKGADKISFVHFLAKYMIVCALPVFVLFLVQLLMSGVFIPTNWIITFLPLVYGIIIQLIFFAIYKFSSKNKQ